MDLQSLVRREVVPKEVDFVGLSIYGGVIVLSFLYLTYYKVQKWWNCQQNRDPILRGAPLGRRRG